MSAEWEVYTSRLHEAQATIRVDLKAHDTHGENTWCLRITIDLQEPGKDGTGVEKEQAALQQIESRLGQLLSERNEAVCVGWLTTQGRRELMFYASHPGELQEDVAGLRREFPGYKLSAGLENDPSWSRFRQILFPRPKDLKRIENRKRVQRLADAGDPLTKPRRVSHWVQFPTADDRKAFLQEVQPEGFKSTAQRVKDDEGEERPFQLQISRDDPVDLDSIHELTLDLEERAAAYDGEYDGWETTPIK